MAILFGFVCITIFCTKDPIMDNNEVSNKIVTYVQERVLQTKPTGMAEYKNAAWVIITKISEFQTVNYLKQNTGHSVWFCWH